MLAKLSSAAEVTLLYEKLPRLYTAPPPSAKLISSTAIAFGTAMPISGLTSLVGYWEGKIRVLPPGLTVQERKVMHPTVASALAPSERSEQGL